MQITYERVRELFKYNGKDLIWNVTKSAVAKKGKIAGHIIPTGYRQTMVDGKRHYAHRLIWLYYYGYIPENNIDHINRCAWDNRIKNLRVVSNTCNQQNCGMRCDNTSGIKGVCFDKARGKWMARIKFQTKEYNLGRHTDFVEAVLFRLAAEQCLNWSNCDSASPAYKYAVKNKLMPRTK